MTVCSVGWAESGAHHAVGTSKGKVQIRDVSRNKLVRIMEGHRLCVGAVAWSSSLLSSGSKDRSILQRDIRAQEDFINKLSGRKSELFIWNQHSTQPVLKYREHTAAVQAIAWSPHLHGLLASGGGTADQYTLVSGTPPPFHT